MSLLILIYWFVITRWDSCSIENRKIVNRLLGFITLRSISIEEIVLIEVDSEIIAKQSIRTSRGVYSYLRITYHNKLRNKDVRYIITPDDDEIFKNQIELMQKDATIKMFSKPKKLIANIVVLLFAVITITLSFVYASVSFDHPIITLLSIFLICIIHRYVIIRALNKLLYDDYRNNLEKYVIRN